MIFNNADSITDEDGEYELEDEDEEDDQDDNGSIASDKSEVDEDLDVVHFDSQFFLNTIDINIIPDPEVGLLPGMVFGEIIPESWPRL